MKKQKLSYQIAGILIIIATLGFTAMYFSQRNIGKKEPVQLAEQENTNPSKSVSKTVEPKTKEVDMEALKKERVEAEKTIRGLEADSEEDPAELVAETATLALHFPEEIAWPMEGKVLLNYSMDQTVYFKTLKQYQYNPALLLQGQVNDKVCSACAGKVVSILNDAKTGTSVTMDLGDGYQAVYGQLKEIPVATGQYVAKGQCIGYLAEPSKYYLEEGPNLYFQLTKDGKSINPQDYLEQ